MQERKNFLTAILLSFFFGTFGADRFYLGCVGTGIVKLLTLGGLGIWALIDLIRLALGSKLCGGFVWDTEISKNNTMNGGACSNDIFCIVSSLIVGGIIFYLFIYEWLKKNIINKWLKNNDIIEEQNNKITK